MLVEIKLKQSKKNAINHKNYKISLKKNKNSIK